MEKFKQVYDKSMLNHHNTHKYIHSYALHRTERIKIDFKGSARTNLSNNHSRKNGDRLRNQLLIQEVKEFGTGGGKKIQIRPSSKNF